MANKYEFEIHNYAPELNKIFYKGADITKMFGNANRRMSRNYKSNVIFLRTLLPNINYTNLLFYEVKKEYLDPQYKCYNRSYRGVVPSRKELLEFKRHMQDKCLKDAKCIFTAKRIYKF